MTETHFHTVRKHFSTYKNNKDIPAQECQWRALGSNHNTMQISTCFYQYPLTINQVSLQKYHDEATFEYPLPKHAA